MSQLFCCNHRYDFYNTHQQVLINTDDEVIDLEEINFLLASIAEDERLEMEERVLDIAWQ